MFSYLWIFFKCFQVLKVTHSFEGNVKRVLSDRSSSDCAMTSTYPVLQVRWILEHFVTHLILNLMPWAHILQKAGGGQSAFLVCSQIVRAAASTTLGVLGVQGQWPPRDFLSPLTSACLQKQNPSPAASAQHPKQLVSWAQQKCRWSFYSERMSRLTSGCRKKVKAIVVPMLRETQTELEWWLHSFGVENNTILPRPLVMFGDYLI